MKKRLGFVSNSSSSSFICEVCGHIESGWDLSLDEARMYECEKGHVYCEDHQLSKDNLNYLSTNYNSPKELCPLCQLESITDDKVMMYLIARSGFENRKQVEDEIRESFKTDEELISDNLLVHFRKLKLNKMK